MRKVKTFFHIFINSLIPQHSYYHKLSRSTFFFSFKYFLCLILFLNIFYLLFFFIKINPLEVKLFINNLTNSLARFPEDLTINIKNCNLVTNYNRPYLQWLNYDQNKKQLLFVVDETATPEKINQYNSYVLITASNLVIKNPEDKNGFRIFPISNLSATIDKKTVSNLNTILNTIIGKLIILISLLMIFFLPPFGLLIALFFLFICSLLVFLICRFVLKKISFARIFQLSLHSSSLPLITVYFLMLLPLFFNTPIRILPHIFFLLNIVFLISAVYETFLDHTDKSINRHSHFRQTRLR